jgi:phage-related minor tail protein
MEALETALSGAAGMGRAFSVELDRVLQGFETTGRGARRFEATLSRGVGRAIDGVVVDGMTLSGALRGIARSMVDAAWQGAVRPVRDQAGAVLTQGIGAILGPLAPFAAGAGFAQGRVMPFASGGIVSGPTAFPMRGDRTGLMGEAGPEAILPLQRGADGRLGVAAAGAGGRPVSVTINVSTPDVAGFQRSQSQIAASLGRALAQGQRNR